MMQSADKIRISLLNLDQAFALLFSAIRGADECTKEKINYSELKNAFMMFQKWLEAIDREGNFLDETEHDELVSDYYHNLLRLFDSG